RPEGKRLSDLQPDQGIADSHNSFRKQLYSFCIKQILGIPQHTGQTLIQNSEPTRPSEKCRMQSSA
ncbi:hypothetical protein ACVGW6_00930, partial [Enterobacter intestinihominis]